MEKCTDADFERLENQFKKKRSDLKQEELDNYIWTHADSLGRILFVYAKLNKAFVYVQGMNEIIAVIYYCLWRYNTEDIISKDQIESDVFVCFSNIMSELGDGFMV
jgi:hypothetical protein